jgi:hypothetical protein
MMLFLSSLSGLLIAIVTSFLTVRLAVWRFHSEKWWEKKAEIYAKLLEALFDMHLFQENNA